MELVRGIDGDCTHPSPSVVSIGMFDGLHLGHRALLERLIHEARESGSQAVAITFDPHPRAVLRPDRPPRILTTLDEKIALMARSGVDRFVVIPFDRRFANTPAKQFVLEILVGHLGMTKLIVGWDFRLGRGREGDGPFLKALGEREDFKVDLLGPWTIGQRPVKSTWVRDEIAAGRVDQAASLLGRYYSMTGRVVRGRAVGRDLGAPTANLEVLHPLKLWPAYGIYAGYVETGGSVLMAAVSIGVRPTFGDSEPLIEAHLLDWEGDLVGKEITLHLVDRIRDEKKFDSAGDLADGIARDIARTRLILAESDQRFLFTAENQFDTFH